MSKQRFLKLEIILARKIRLKEKLDKMIYLAQKQMVSFQEKETSDFETASWTEDFWPCSNHFDNNLRCFGKASGNGHIK